MLYFTESDVQALLPMKDCIRMMQLAFEALRDEAAQNQPRRRLILKTGSVLHSLAGAYGNYFGTKFYSTNPKHGAHFLFALYDAATAEPLALMEANHLGQIRTGAASGYATDLMANPQAEVLGVIGSGFQARTQVEAIRAVRRIVDVRVWSRTPEKVRRFAQELNAKPMESAQLAVRDADIVVTATNSREPVVEAGWIRKGTHINAMGSNAANRRELSGDLVAQADVVAVDSLEQAKTEAGDLILAPRWETVVELQNMRAGYNPTRITIFKSIGLGLEDVAAGAFVYEEALRRKLGKPFIPEPLVGRNPARR